MNGQNYLRLLFLAAIVVLVAWLAIPRKIDAPHTTLAAGHETSPAKAKPATTRQIESAAIDRKPAPLSKVPTAQQFFSSGNPTIRQSDVELQSRPMSEVKLMSPRVAVDVPLLPGFVGPPTWRNLGTLTASAAFETHCWAIDRGDADVLLSTVDLSDASRTKLKIIFDRLPPEDRAKYGSPERMLGLIWVYHGLPFSGFIIESEVPHAPAEVGVLLQLQYGREGANREFMFKRSAEGWRKITPDQQVDNFLRRSGISPDVVP